MTDSVRGHMSRWRAYSNDWISVSLPNIGMDEAPRIVNPPYNPGRFSKEGGRKEHILPFVFPILFTEVYWRDNLSEAILIILYAKEDSCNRPASS